MEERLEDRHDEEAERRGARRPALPDDSRGEEADGEERKERLKGMMRGLGLGGGLLLAAADRDGKPSLGWRYHNFLEHRADLRDTKSTLKDRYASA